ncbi:long-chain fatty acid--CoA ligase [Pseudonocardia aurantiaca]|uniref:AMP-binding protein n=1 Tax=Pseudonocardia aurantiaca TaxID=75290 RepID=A0ABW4FLR1_9PSEU
MGFGAHDWTAHHASHRPAALALSCAEDGRALTWGELDDRVGRVAQVLADLGVGRGDRIALVAENDPRVFEVQFAAMRLGALFVPLNWRLTVHEMAEICHDAEPAAIVHDDAWAQAAGEIAEKVEITRRLAWGAALPAGATDYEAALAAAGYHGPRAGIELDHPTHVLYTSGTTGKPKGALSTHSTLLWQAFNTAQTTGYSQPGCHHLNPMPLFHAGGLHVMANPILYFGGAVTTMTRFTPDAVLARLAGSSPPITHFAAIPLMYQAVAAQPGFADADLSHARHFIIAGAIATPELLQLWADRGVALQPQYGGTEMGPMATALDNEATSLAKAKQGSTGRRARHTDVRLVDPDGNDVPDGETGEIWLRGPSITVGYWRKDRADYFTGDWFRTGDAARRDADGFYYLAGRTKDMYKSGGENVYPAEVENVLSLHPAVADVAVVGIPDARWGEVGAAVVVPAPGAELTLDHLNEFASGRLARFKMPKKLVLVDALPRNVTGKVNRAELAATHGAPNREGTA